VIFSFDGDKAGRRAARRALEACLPHVTDNKTIKFLFLPTEHDPDSYVRAYGREAFEQEIHEAMPLSQFLIREAVGEHDLNSPEGRARIQFDAKPMLQAMTPTALRLQIVRSLAQMTQTTPSEVEALYELAKPVAVTRKAPPRAGRTQPKGLELQIMRVLVAHPALAPEIDAAAMQAFQFFGAEAAERLGQLVAQALALGDSGTFAAFAQHLKSLSDEYDGIIGEIVKEPETERDTERVVLRAAVRQVKHDALKQELSQLFAAGLSSDEIGVRYRELTAQQDQLLREAQAELSPR
jgi:DNA primase